MQVFSLPAKNIQLLFLGILFLTGGCQQEITRRGTPNILFIFVDDMGYGDLGCYGNDAVSTPNIDRLASEGIRLSQFYVNSPICSPSRTAVITGQNPSRWGITSFIDTRANNQRWGMANYLDTLAPAFPRQLKEAGYYTAHIGKWHLGGGRDIGEAPLITEYGFNESITQFEGLGPRYLATFETLDRFPTGRRKLEEWSAELGRGKVKWAERDAFTRIFVDHTLEAIDRAQAEKKPFYVQLWPDAIHTPLEPPEDLRGDLTTRDRFLGVMQEMDHQFGRLFERIRQDPDLAENTLIVLTSDNGPDRAVNKAGHLRGYKTNLYEGGIREPFIAWWPAQIPSSLEGSIDSVSVMAAIDLAPTFLAAAGIGTDQQHKYDGRSMLPVLQGQRIAERNAPLYWIRPPDRPGYDGDNDPDLGMRQGDYKLLMDVDGSNRQLYYLPTDPGESKNLAEKQPEKADALSNLLQAWYHDYPHQIDTALYQKGL